MSITATAAANAYAATAKVAKTVEPAAKEVSQGFGDLLKNALSTVQEAGRMSDKVVAEAAVGKADMVQVVTAVAETELAMETLVSVRDRVISAYEEILRMPI